MLKEFNAFKKNGISFLQETSRKAIAQSTNDLPPISPQQNTLLWSPNRSWTQHCQYSKKATPDSTNPKCKSPDKDYAEP